LACVLLPALALPVAAVAATDRPQLQITRTAVAPVIDGLVDEALWEQAALIDDLRQIRPNDGEAATERSEIRVTYDADALYIAARFWESGGQDSIRASIMRQNSRLSEDDRIAIILDPFDSSRTG